MKKKSNQNQYLFFIVLVISFGIFISVNIFETGGLLSPAGNLFAPSVPLTMTFSGVSVPGPPCTTLTNTTNNLTQNTYVCAGTYDFGLIISASNVYVTLQDGVIFDGSKIRDFNGLVVHGQYKNITVETENNGTGIFKNFIFRGALLSGGNTFNGTPTFLDTVFIENVDFINNGMGIEISHNTKNIVLKNGQFASNYRNGILISSTFVDPILNYKVEMIRLFPNTLHIIANNISGNNGSGILIDANEYYRRELQIRSEENSILIKGNKILENVFDGIKVASYYHFPIKPFQIRENHISFNDKSGIHVVSEQKGRRFLDVRGFPIYYTESYSWGGDIYKNSIKNNGRYGIRIANEAPKQTPFQIGRYYVQVSSIYDNVIHGNVLDGIYGTMIQHHVRNYSSVFSRGEVVLGQIGRNIISDNKNGIFAEYDHLDQMSGYVVCNDILRNRISGVEVFHKEFEVHHKLRLHIEDLNIIEKSQNGIKIFHSTLNYNPWRANYLFVKNNHIGENSRVGVWTNFSQLGGWGEVSKNDIVNNSLQAFDVHNISWFRNYWSDTSPSCIDQNRDNYCDSPRRIPLNSSDVQPAKYPYNYKNRSYYEEGDVGIDISKPLNCTVVKLPHIPPIMKPPKPSSGGGIEP